MAPKPLNHNPTNLKKVPNGFPTSEYPNKCTICTYKKHSLSKNAKYKVAFFFLGLLGNISSRILSRPWTRLGKITFEEGDSDYDENTSFPEKKFAKLKVNWKLIILQSNYHLTI